MKNRVAKVLLYGLPASGKSSSIATLFKLKNKFPTQRVILLCTERNSLAGVEFGLKHHKIALKEGDFIYNIVRPKGKKAFLTELNALTAFTKQTQADAQKGDGTNQNKDKYTYFNDIINGLTSFTGIDYVTGEEVKLGNVGELHETDILVIDGLSTISYGIWNIVKGDRVISQLQDYGTIQHWLNKFTQGIVNLDCSVILLAHADRVTDEVEKVEKIRVSLEAGNALAAKYIGNFSDCVYCYSDTSGKRLWAGRKVNVETAARSFPEQDKLEPDFSLYNFFKD